MSPADIIPFNPLEKKNLGESVAQALICQPVVCLAELLPFDGAGIYAIYYTGDFDCYQTLVQYNINGRFCAPIYAGKAVPKGSRKGAELDLAPGKAIYNRIKQHVKSIEQAKNLCLSDFYCRYLIVDDIWIPLGESLLIAKSNPLWNLLIDGFGNHDPGKGRHAGLRPRWDVLHPGRPWADKCKPREETDLHIKREVTDYLAQNPLLNIGREV